MFLDVWVHHVEAALVGSSCPHWACFGIWVGVEPPTQQLVRRGARLSSLSSPLVHGELVQEGVFLRAPNLTLLDSGVALA